MNILLCVNSYLPRIGGRELVVHHLATQFQTLGHRVTVAGPAGWYRQRSIRFSYPIRRWPVLPLLGQEGSGYAAMAMTGLTGSYDVIHAHSTYPNGYLAARTRRCNSAPLVITPHGEDINVIPEIGFGVRLDPDADRKIRFALASARRVTAISETIVESLRSADVPDAKIVRISNGVDLQRFQTPDDPDVLKWLDFPEDTFLVVSIGNYHRRKGHEILIDAVAAAITEDSRIRLAIVGHPSAALCRSTAERGLDSHVRFVGTLPVPMPGSDPADDRLAALLHAADAYASSSMDEGAEGLSLALLEAMAAGACPVATSISGNRDVVHDGQTGLLATPGDPASLAGALLRLSADRALLERLQYNARAHVQQFGWRQIAERYLETYRAAASA